MSKTAEHDDDGISHVEEELRQAWKDGWDAIVPSALTPDAQWQRNDLYVPLYQVKKRQSDYLAEALDTVLCNMDANGDPVGAKPENDWEKGYAAGLRHVYRVLKGRGFNLPVASPDGGGER